MQAGRPSQALVVVVAIAMLATPTRVALAIDDPAAATKHADDPSAVEARHRYEEGTKAFNLGEYPRAIAEFKAAYNAKPDPLLLYNIAQSFRLAGDAAQALFFYRSFLRNMPNASNRKEVEGRIRTLEKQAEKQVDEQKKEPAVTPLTPPAPTATTVPPPVVGAPAPPPPTPSPAAIEPAPASPVANPAGAPAAPIATGSPSEDMGAAAPATTVDLTTPAPPQAAPSAPFYKRWWFWTGIGALVLIGLAAKTHDKPPGSTLGAYDPTFMKSLGAGP